MRPLIWAAMGALTLTACQKAAQSGAAGAAATPVPAASGGVTTMPLRRAGLWQQTMSRDGKPIPMAMVKICVDAATEAQGAMLSHAVAGRAQRDCATPQTSRGLDGSYTFSSTCTQADGAKTVSKGTMTGDFNDNFDLHLVTDTTGSSFAPQNGHHETEMSGKWMGQCPAGMAGGDMEMANGMRINTGKLAGAAAALKGAVGNPGQ